MTIDNITTEELIATAKEEFAKDPMSLVESGMLSIRTKDAKLIRFKPNPAQRILNAIIRRIERKNKPVRLNILKARQEGCSTDIEALLYSFTSQRSNVNSLIMADEKEHSNNLFEMSKLYHAQMEKEFPGIAPKLKKSNEKALEFEDIHSKTVIATAENVEAAISYTFHFVHNSECAYFRDFPMVMNNLNQSVPDLPGTYIFNETTANGIEAFYRAWKEAMKGLSDWVNVFIPWFFMPEYAKDEPFPIESLPFDIENNAEKFLKEEEELVELIYKAANGIKEEFGIDLHLDDDMIQRKLNWRRWAIVNKFLDAKNQAFNKFDLFRQYYPATWREAFLMSGSKFFSKAGLREQEKHVIQPVSVGEIVEVEKGNYEWRDYPTGRIKIYEHPKKNEMYYTTGDSSEAIGQDEASLFVGNVRTNTTAAVVNGQYEPEDLADLAVKIGNYYNKALLAIETKSYGTAVNKAVGKKYGNIYSHPGKDEYGFVTSLVTRPEMLAYMSEEVSLNNTRFLDSALYEQCMSFIINPKSKKAEADAGEEDGLVICRAIFSYVRRERPYKIQEDEEGSIKRRGMRDELLRRRSQRKPVVTYRKRR